MYNVTKLFVSAKLIGEEIGVTTRGVEKNIRALKKAGLIERVGTPKYGHWIVKDIKANH